MSAAGDPSAEGAAGRPGAAAGAPSGPTGPVRVRLLGREGCHLCDVARDVVARVTAETGTAFDEVDVDTDPGLRERYADLVPVVLVDGAEHAHWRVEAGRLRAALR